MLLHRPQLPQLHYTDMYHNPLRQAFFLIFKFLYLLRFKLLKMYKIYLLPQLH